MAVTSFPKSEIKILLLENIHPIAKHVLESDGFAVESRLGALPESELVARVRDAHVLGIRSKTQVTPAVLDEARRLLAVGAFCIGTNQIALAHAHTCGVPVFNAPFSNTRVGRRADSRGDRHAVAPPRRPPARGPLRNRGRRWQLAATRSAVTTLGIVGYGHIGSQIGVLAEAFGMRVLFYDIVAKLPMGNNRAVDKLGAPAR